MPRTVRSGLLIVLMLLGVSYLHGQPPQAGPAVDRPTVHVPLKPTTRPPLDHVEAVKLFGLAAILEKQNRLIEAVRTLEAARRLDPEAAAPVKALVFIYQALDRTEDALAGCRRVLELDPDDCEIAYLFSRKLRGRGEVREARTVLQRAANSAALQERLELKAQISFDLGVLCEDAGDWSAAEKSLRRVIEVVDNPAALMEQGSYSRDEIDARAAETYERLGRICLHAGQANRAIEAFEKAQKRDPLRAPRLALNLAEVLVHEGRPAEALARLEEYLRSQPQGIEGYELKIKLQRQVGRAGDVLPNLEAAAGRDRHNISLWLLLAREYERTGQAEMITKGAQVYDRLLKDAPSPEVYRGLFGLYKKSPELGGPDSILSRLDKALAEAVEKDDKPGDANQAAHARAMLQVLSSDAELMRGVLAAAGRRLHTGTRMAYATQTLLGTLAARTRQLDVAESLYRDCLQKTRFPGNPRFNEHEVYQGLLLVLQRAYKYQEVIDLCQEGLKEAQATNRVLFHMSLAQAHIALGHEREALAAVDEAVNESGEKDRMRCRLQGAEVLSQAGRHEQATTECRSLLKEYNQPGDARTIRLVLSALYSAARQYDKAEVPLQQILEDDPNDATANNDLGYQWADQNKNLDEAERRIRKALDLDREQRRTGTALDIDSDADNAAYMDSLGWVLFRRGKWEEARKELERAAALPTGAEDPVVWDHLGDVYQRLHQAAQAGSAWRKAVTLYEAGHRPRNDGRYDEIKQKLRLLEP